MTTTDQKMSINLTTVVLLLERFEYLCWQPGNQFRERKYFEVSGDRTCVAKINFDTKADGILCVTHFVYEEFEPEDEEEEESGVDMDDFDGMNELLDDLLCERDELFTKCD